MCLTFSYCSNQTTTFGELKTCQDIVIKPADKGSATVVISREAYISKADRQLNNTNHYRKLDRDLTS